MSSSPGETPDLRQQHWNASLPRRGSSRSGPCPVEASWDSAGERSASSGSRCGEKWASEAPEACAEEGTPSFPGEERKGWAPSDPSTQSSYSPTLDPPPSPICCLPPCGFCHFSGGFQLLTVPPGPAENPSSSHLRTSCPHLEERTYVWCGYWPYLMAGKGWVPVTRR